MNNKIIKYNDNIQVICPICDFDINLNYNNKDIKCSSCKSFLVIDEYNCRIIGIDLELAVSNFYIDFWISLKDNSYFYEVLKNKTLTSLYCISGSFKDDFKISKESLIKIFNKNHKLQSIS